MLALFCEGLPLLERKSLQFRTPRAPLTEKFTDPMPEAIQSRLERADLDNLHENRAPALSAPVSTSPRRRNLVLALPPDSCPVNGPTVRTI